MTRPNVILLGLNALLAALLAMVFLSGRAQWNPPAPLLPELPRLASAADIAPVDDDVIATIIERPLFFESRRPLPKEAPAEQASEAAKDPFEGIVLDGFYSAGGAKGGVTLLDREGKRMRVLLGANLGEWALVSLSGREAKFRRQGEERILSLRRAEGPSHASAPGPGTRVRGDAEPPPPAASLLPMPATVPSARAPQPQPGAAEATRARVLEARRQALERRRSALEARRKQLEAPGAASRAEPFGLGDSAQSKP
ncbi:MAG: hypothetical protein KDG55_01175 [Rhodocyclaceae bacterium]|nr:hypothetical protein [Rhodocyclaceae bacterium]